MRGAQQQKGSRRQGPRHPQQQQPHVLSNLQSLLLHTAPCLPVRSTYDDLESPSSPTGAYFTLQDLWQGYEAWSAYGCEVPVRINVDGVWQEVIQCYTPHLSGLQLFGADHTRRIPTSASSAAMSGYCSEDEGEGEGGEAPACGACDSASSCCSACTSSTASTASTTSDSDSEDALCKESPTAAAGAAAARLARRAERGSVLPKRHSLLGEPSQPFFEYMEVERPHLRAPLHDKVMELAEQCPELLSLDTRDLHPTSWFAITWVPIYRVPSVPDPASSRDLQANFLTFHSLAVPQQRLHSTPADLCSIAPLPPLLDPIGAAAVAWRTEVARQHLLATALSAMAAAQQQQQKAAAAAAAAAVAAAADSLPTTPCGSSCGGGSAASTPLSSSSTPLSTASSASSLASQLASIGLDASAAAAAAASKLAQLPLAACCLRPFAFMPYKASGATWVDDWNLQRQHLPMIAAAGSWVERRKVQLPDFDFMSQMYRPLPTSFHSQYRGGR